MVCVRKKCRVCLGTHRSRHILPDLRGLQYPVKSVYGAPGEGSIDFERVIAALKQVNYSGYLSAEIRQDLDPETAIHLNRLLGRSRAVG